MKFETQNQSSYLEELYDGVLELDNREYTYKVERVWDGLHNHNSIDWLIDIPPNVDEIEIAILDDFENKIMK